MYYAKYGNTYSVENLAWSGDQILGKRNGALRGKVREGLIGVSDLEAGGNLVFKMMLGIVMNVEDISLRSLTQSLQKLRLMDVPGENFGTAVSYLKGALMLLQHCDAVPMDTMGLLNEVMCSSDCGEFSEYMKSIYYASTRHLTPEAYMEYGVPEHGGSQIQDIIPSGQMD